MASEHLAKQIRRVNPRNISALVLLSLGAANILSPSTSGSTVYFIERHTGITSLAVGITLLATGFLVMVVQKKGVYFLSSGMFGLYALIAFVGALFREVPYNASILSIGIFLFTLWSFPDEDKHGA
jgi:hypothetical protein